MDPNTALAKCCYAQPAVCADRSAKRIETAIRFPKPRLPDGPAALVAIVTLLMACAGDGPTDPPPVATTGTLTIAPGAMLFGTAGETQRLRAFVIDADGDSSLVEASFRSSNPAVVSIAGDVATAGAALGSAQITATSGHLASASILVLRAATTSGSLLVADSQLVGPIEPVDPAAAYGPGWQYRLRLRGESPAIGQILLGSGGAPVGGRVVSVAPGANDVVIVLELIPLRDLLPDLTFRERLPIRPAPSIPSSVRRAAPPAISTTAGAGRIETEFERGPFKCKGETAAPLVFPLTVDVFSYEAHPDLAYDVEFVNGSLGHIVVQGTIAPRISANPLITAALDGKATCKVEFREFPLPIGGPLALFIGGQVPVGLGFQIRARAEFGQIGFDAFLDATVTSSFGVECAPECTVGGSIAIPSHDGYFKPRLPGLGTDARLDLSAGAFVYGELKLGSPLSEDLQLKVAEVRGGLEQDLELASREVQAADPGYASSYALKPLLEAKAESTLSTLGNLLSVNLTGLNFTPALPALARSPRGTLTITPASVAAGNATALGERATFTVALTDPTYLGAYAVEGVEIRWRKQNGTAVSIEPGRPGCTDIEAAQDQLVFTCETDFREEHAGEQTFHAFVRTRIFGVPIPVPVEVAPSGAATLRVTATNEAATTLEGDASPGSGASVSFHNAGSAPGCADSEPPDEVETLPSLAISAACSTNATSNEGAALSGTATTAMTYAFDTDGNTLRSFTVTAQARVAARGEGEVPGNLAAQAGRTSSNSISNVNFEFEVHAAEAEVTLSGQLTSAISLPAGNIVSAAVVRLRGPGGSEWYLAIAGREQSTDDVLPNVAIGTTLRLPRGVYDLSAEVVAFANTYVDYPNLEGESGLSLTMTLAP